MTVITLAQVKSLLGITDIDYDAQINAAIPRIDSIVKRITKNRYNMQLLCNTVAGSTDVIVLESYAYNGVKTFDGVGLSLSDVVTNGQQVEGTGIPAGAFVTDVFSNGIVYNGSPTLRLSAACTATGQITVMTGIPVDIQTVIAQGIWYIISGDKTKATDESWTSRSMGPLSVSRGAGDANKIDGASGMPMWLIRAFPHFQGGW